MKKYTFLLVAILFALCMNAKKICLWHEGSKLYELTVYANDSITFAADNPSGQTMCIWRKGNKLQEISIQENDSITYSIVPTFDYDNWRDQTTIPLYYNNQWNTVNLPWAEVAVTTMPKHYRFPNKEYIHDTVPKWELAFNLCDDPNLPGVHTFGLWDWRSQVMRIYSYLEEQPSQNAKYCFYEITTTDPLSLERDAMTWQPSSAIIADHHWDESKIPSSATAPSDLWCQLMPIAGTLDGQVNRGWLCFDMNLSVGKNKLPKDGTITIAMYAVQKIDLTGTMNLNVKLESENGQITIPGNKNKKASGYWAMAGGFLSGIASSFAQAVSVGLSDGFGDYTRLAGYTQGIAGGLGALFSGIGEGINAEHNKDTVHYSLQVDFHGTASGTFTGQLSTTTGTSVSPVTMSFNKFFGNALTGSHSHQIAHARKTNNDSISVGLWNLKNQPVLYVCKDAYNMIVGPSGDESLISFLDPASIDVIINKANQLFDINSIDSIILIPYDFAFVNGDYNLSAEPYYGYYRIEQDTILKKRSMQNSIGLDISSYLLTKDTAFNTFSKGKYAYSGISAGFLSNYGLEVYNLVYSPAIILQDRNYFDTVPQTLSEIGVGVVVEVKFKTGESRVFAERFLPEIKTFTMAEAPALIEQFQNLSAPTTLDGFAAACPLFEKQKQKALRMLYAAAYPIQLDYTEPPFLTLVAGLRVHPWQNDMSPGLVILPSKTDPGHRYSCQTLQQVFEEMESSAHGDWNLYDDRIKNIVTMVPLAGTAFKTSDPNHDFVIGSGCTSASGEEAYISLYQFDSEGYLTLITE
ncbi:MAG: hypothetical protein J6T80_00290 [Paludibacteraceae bacterium]|nr:hypothetical protein [Paludibacteraceae bacterium]